MKDPIQDSLNKIRLVESHQVDEYSTAQLGQDTGDLARGAWQGLTFGLGNKIAAGAQSAFGSKSYQDYLDQQEEADAAAQERSPWLYGAGELAGGIGVPGAGLAGMAARKGATKLAGKALGTGERGTKWAGRVGKAGEAGASNAVNTVGGQAINQAGGSMLDKLAVPAAAAGAVGLGAAAANAVGSRKSAPNPTIIQIQKKILAKDPNALPKFGADGRMGTETQTAMKKYGITMESKSSIMMELENLVEKDRSNRANRAERRRSARQSQTDQAAQPANSAPEETPTEKRIRVQREIGAQLNPSSTTIVPPAASGTPTRSANTRFNRRRAEPIGGQNNVHANDTAVAMRSGNPGMVRRAASMAGKGALGLGTAAGLGYLGYQGYQGAKGLKDKIGQWIDGNPNDPKPDDNSVNQQNVPSYDNNNRDQYAPSPVPPNGIIGSGDDNNGAVDQQASPDNSAIYAELAKLAKELEGQNDPNSTALRTEYLELMGQTDGGGGAAGNSAAGDAAEQFARRLKNAGKDALSGAANIGRGIVRGFTSEDVELDSVLRNAGLGHN
jgi:hypothetical protein